MKLVRYGRPGKEKPGLIDANGKIRDLSKKVGDIGPAALSPASLKKLAKLKPASLPLVRGTPRFGPPVAGIGKLVAIGLNYSDHAAETGAKPPERADHLHEGDDLYRRPRDDVIIPKDSKKSDWEVELGVVIGTKAHYVAEKDALKHVAGYLICNDVSERAYQTERGGTWDKGKGCDTFGPLGPWLVTARRSTRPAEPGHVAGR